MSFSSSHLGLGSLACLLALAACGKSGAQGMGGASSSSSSSASTGGAASSTQSSSSGTGGTPLTTCNGVMTDTKTDSANCGACDHGCLGGICVLGLCQPVALTTPFYGYGLAVDDNGLYWYNEASGGGGGGGAGGGSGLPSIPVMKLAKTGGTPQQIGAFVEELNAFQLLNGTLYAIDEVGIRTLDVTTGAATVVDKLMPTDPAYEVEISEADPVFGSSHVYFVTTSQASVDVLPFGQGATPTYLNPNDMILGSYELSGFTTDGTQLYISGNGFSGQGGDTLLVPVDGSEASVFVPGYTGELAFTSQYVVGLESFFNVQAYAEIWIAPRAGGAAKQLYMTSDSIEGIVADDANVYWWDLTTGEIMSVPTSGGTPEFRYGDASNLMLDPGSSCFAADADALYFNTYDGFLYKLAK